MSLDISKISGLTEARGHHFCAESLDQDSIVIDLGSHLGEFSKILSESLDCKCYAVEALPSLYERIQTSDLIKKFNYAISGGEQEVKLCISDNPEGNYVKGTRSKSEEIENIVSVNGITLSHFVEIENIKKIDLLKIDIEGSEISLFDSSSDVFLKSIDQISIEFHDFSNKDMKPDVKRVRKRLKSLGFICVKYSFHSNGDILFLNPQKLKLGAVQSIYIQFLSRYVRGIPRATRKIFNWKV